MFTYGSLDPWASIGLQETIPVQNQVGFVKMSGFGHCGDINLESASDSEVLKRTRASLKKSIQFWICQNLGC